MGIPINSTGPTGYDAIIANAVPDRPSTFVITSAMIHEHTLQGMVELQYVRIGTEVMNSALTRLDAALTLTQKALDQLASLQQLHNSLGVTANSTFPLNFTTTDNQTITLTAGGSYTRTFLFGTITGSETINNPLSTTHSYTFLVHDRASFVSAYQKLASSYYGVPIKPFFQVVLPSTADHPAYSTTIISGHEAAYSVFLAMLKSAKTDLNALIAELSANTRPGDRNTLYAQLKSVRDDFPDFTSFSAVQKWAIDNYGGSTAAAITKQGNFQQHITNAITAAESTNTTQQEAVRRYMFVFEQYCQSAAAILKALDQIFEKIARGISG